MTQELSREQQIDICNAVNTAIANGKRVHVGTTGRYGASRVMGAFPRHNQVCLVNYDGSSIDQVATLWLKGMPIRSFIPVESDVEIIYEPPTP